MNDIKHDVRHYGIGARDKNDGTTWWESVSPNTVDYRSGEEEYYAMHIKNLDGSDLSKEEFAQMNEFIKSV
jgi:hypothetical protein